MNNQKLADWIKSSTEFLASCNPDDRLASIALLHGEVVVNGIAKGSGMTEATRRRAAAELGKHLIRSVAAFVSENRMIWIRNGKP